MDAYITRNGITLHVVDMDGIRAHNLPESFADKFYNVGGGYYISTFMDGQDMATFVLGNDATYDFAMPYGVAEYGKPGYIWLYERGVHFGKAYNLAENFKSIVKSMVK